MTKKTVNHEDIIDAETVEEMSLTKRDRVQLFVSKHGKKIALGTGAVVSAFVLGRLFERTSFLETLIDIDAEDDSEDDEFDEIETTEED